MTNDQKTKTGLVPIGVTIGLGALVLFLSCVGFWLRWILGEPSMVVLSNAIKIVPIFVIVIPSLTCVFALLMNKIKQTHIKLRNAWTLGWLLSAVGLITIMGAYS